MICALGIDPMFWSGLSPGMVGEKDKRYNNEERQYSATTSVIKTILSHGNIKTINCLRS